MHWRRAHLLGSCAAACSAIYVWPAADACSSGLQVGWLGASLVMAPCASFSFRHGHRAYTTRRMQPRCPAGVGHTTRGPTRLLPRLGALIRCLPSPLLVALVLTPACRVIHTVWRFAALHPSAPQLASGWLRRSPVAAGAVFVIGCVFKERSARWPGAVIRWRWINNTNTY